MNGQKGKTNKQQMKGIICTMTGAILWGFSGTCGQYLFQEKHIDASWLTCMRMFFAGIILVVACFFNQRDKLKAVLKDKKDVCQIIVFGLLGLAVCQYTYLTAVAYTNAGTATVLQYLGPVLIMLLVCMRKMKLPTLKETLAVICAVAGIFVLATHGKMDTLVISKEGLFWGISSAFGLVLYTLIPVRVIRKWGSTVITAYGMLSGGIVLWLTLKPWQTAVVFDLGTIIGVGAMIILGTAIPFVLYLYGVGEIGSVKASMLASVEPLAATIFSAVLLGTSFSLLDIIGFACIISTVFLLAGKE